MSLTFNPWFIFPEGTSVPWMAIARHSAALTLYMLAFVQWPGYVVSEWAGEDRAFAYNLTSLMFTLSFWCACLFHYLVSAGRVEVNWANGRVRAKGWIVKTSRRAHRVLLSLALAISAMTIVQSTTTAMVITHFYLREDAPNAKEHAILILLKVDQTLAFFMFIYVLGRLVFEPVSIRKPRARTMPSSGSSADSAATPVLDESQPMKPIPTDTMQECTICVERWANRALGCGHVLCCCCLGEIWKAEGYTTPKCPFCRLSASSVRQIIVSDGGKVSVNQCCGDIIPIPTSTSSSTSADHEEVSHPSPDGSPRVRWAAASMRNAFGLKLVHLFFNIPFLVLQRETLKLQLERNKDEILSSYTELDCYQETPEADYERFMDMVTQRRREIAENQGARVYGGGTGEPRVMGGGQPIPGQKLPSTTPRSTGNAATGSETTSSTHSPNPGSMTSDRRNSFEMVGEEAIDSFLADDEAAAASAAARPSKLVLNARASAADSDDEADNVMVRKVEEDFSDGEELVVKMAKAAEETKLQADETLLRRQQQRLKEAEARFAAQITTPDAYKLNIGDQSTDTDENDEPTTVAPARESPLDFGGPKSHTSSRSPSAAGECLGEDRACGGGVLLTPTQPMTQAVPSASMGFSAADLDAWLGGSDDGAEATSIGTNNATRLADEEDDCDDDEPIGVPLPARMLAASSGLVEGGSPLRQPPKPAAAVVVAATPEESIDDEDSVYEEPKPVVKKKIKKTTGEKKTKSLKTSNEGGVAEKPKKKKKSKEATVSEGTSTTSRSTKDARNALEEFLGYDDSKTSNRKLADYYDEL